MNQNGNSLLIDKIIACLILNYDYNMQDAENIVNNPANTNDIANAVAAAIAQNKN